MAPEFVPGLELARGFYATVVGPLLAEQFPQVPYAAALLGPGSEVAGFDSPRSTDHDWGPRLQIFLADGDADGGVHGHATAITAMLASRLPESFRGYPVAFPVARGAWHGTAPGEGHRPGLLADLAPRVRPAAPPSRGFPAPLTSPHP